MDDAIEDIVMTPGYDMGVDSTSTFSIRGVGNPTLQSKSPLKRIVVRIEVSDTGSGIPSREITQGKLFSKSCQVWSHFGSNFPPAPLYSRVQSN